MAELPGHPDVRFRPMAASDAEEAFALTVECQEFDTNPYRATIGELEYDLSASDIDLATDSIAAIDQADRMVGYGLTRLREPSLDEHNCYLWGFVRPSCRRRGIGSAILDWQRNRGAERLHTGPPDRRRLLKTWAMESEQDRQAFFEANGFAIARYFFDMIRPLGELPTVACPAGIAVIPWSEDLSEAVRQAHNDAFRDHWGSSPMGAQEWAHFLDFDSIRLDLSLIAVTEAEPIEVVGYSLNFVAPQDFAIRGRKEGWVGTLGTPRAWRKRGIASHLISESCKLFAAEGLDHAALDVDAANPTGALGLYERLGFTTMERSFMFVLEV